MLWSWKGRKLIFLTMFSLPLSSHKLPTVQQLGGSTISIFSGCVNQRNQLHCPLNRVITSWIHTVLFHIWTNGPGRAFAQPQTISIIVWSLVNRLLLSFPKPPHFHTKKGFELSLIFKVRVFGTWKSPIESLTFTKQ